jgi:hypothetical protein
MKEGAGANYAAAAKAAANYVGQAISDHQAGLTHRGKPWVRMSNRTKRYEFLYTTEHVDDEYKMSSILTKSEKQTVRDAAVGKGGSAGSKHNPDTFTKQVEATTPASKRPRKAEPKSTEKTTEGLEGPAKLKKKGGPSDGFARSKQLRARYDSVLSLFNEVKSNIESKDDWSWGKAPSLHDPLMESRKELSTFKDSSMFWSQWALQGTFVNYAKKTYSAETCEAELAKMPLLDEKIKKLEAVVAGLFAMRQAMPF